MAGSLLVVVAIFTSGTGVAQPANRPMKSELAGRIVNRETRAEVIREIDGQRPTLMPILLTIAEEALTSSANDELRFALIDVFAKLKAVEGVPFLTKNMRLARWRSLNPWMVSSSVIRDQYPALDALILIGQPASQALVELLERPLLADEQVAAVFVVAQVGSPGDAKVLEAMKFQAALVKLWANDGLERIRGQSR